METKNSSVEVTSHIPHVPWNGTEKHKKCKTVVRENETSSGEDDEPCVSDYRMLEMKLKLAESKGNVEEKDDDFPDFEDLFSGTLPCSLLYFDRKLCRFTQIRTFDELTKYMETGDLGVNPDNSVLGALVSAPATRLVHFATLGNYLRTLYETDRLMDVCIEVDGTLFRAHMVALCSCSGYFSNLFASEKFPKVPIRVRITGINAEAFSAFLEFVYTGDMTLHHGIAADISLISEYLDVAVLKEKLARTPYNLTIPEAVKLLFMRRRDSSDEVYNTALAKVIDQFTHAAMATSFLDLDVDTFCKIIGSDNLRVSSEFEVFQVAIRWIVHGAKSRLQHVSRVMNNVRFCYMSQSELFNCLIETSLFMDNKELRDLVLIANWVLTAVRLQREDPFHFKVPSARKYYSKSPLQKNPKCDNIQHQDEVYGKAENFQHSKQACGRYGKPLLLPQELATSPRYSVLPETIWTTRPATVSPKHAKPVLVQQELAQSSYTPEQGYCGIKQRAKKQSTDVQKPALSPACLAKPTIFSQNANQSSNTDPGANFVPQSSSSDSLYLEDALGSKTRHTARSVNEMIMACSLQSSSSLTTASHTVRALDYVSCESVRESRKGREIVSETIKSRHTGQRYVISPEPYRSARPVMLPTEVRTEPDMRVVPNVGASPEIHQRHQPLSEIIVLGSFEKDLLTEEGELCQSDAKGRSIQYCNLPEPRRYFAVAMVAKYVYIIGGYNPTSAGSDPGVTNSVARMDCGNKRWRTVEPMLDARMCHCACALENYVYVFGGLDKNERPLAACECYNTCTDQWSRIESLPVPIYAGSAASLGGKCYIAGGLSKNDLDNSVRVLMTMICFNPKNKKWSCNGYLRMPLCHASLVNLGGRLYLCGGATQRKAGRKHEFLSVPYIDEFNFLNNSWHFRTEMATPRHEACVAVVGSRLYVIGGKNSAEENIVSSIECYDTRVSMWIKGPLQMPRATRWINCVTYKENKDS